MPFRNADDAHIDLSVLNWKPISDEMFVKTFQNLATDPKYVDDSGNCVFSSKTVYAGGGASIATVFYVEKSPSRGVFSPRLMSMCTKDNRRIHFEWIGEIVP